MFCYSCFYICWVKSIDDIFCEIVGLLDRPVIFDGRNQYNPEFMQQHGITYYSIGRNAVDRSGKQAKGYQ